MAEPLHRTWTLEEFFAWQEGQPDRYELVDGYPLKMMAGAKNVHDDIVVNFVGELRDQVRGTGCRPFTGDEAWKPARAKFGVQTWEWTAANAIRTPRKRRFQQWSSKSCRQAPEILTPTGK